MDGPRLSRWTPLPLSLPGRARALPRQTFQVSCAGQDNSHGKTHTQGRKQHNVLSYLPFSGFSNPMRESREGCAGGIWDLSSSLSRPCPSLPLLRLISPCSPLLPQYQPTGYPGNPAGRLPVTTATQHGRQAALLRKVRGPAGLQSSWDAAGRTGPGRGAYVPERTKFLLSGDHLSVSHEAGSPSLGHEPQANLPHSVAQATPEPSHLFNRVPVTSLQGRFLRLSSNWLSLSLTPGALSPSFPS